MPRARLRCVAGETLGETIEIDDELVVGRHAPGLGRLGADPLLSRRHARFAFDAAGRLLVEDLGSTNGTRVNGEPITQPRPLRAGDEVRFGRATLTVELPAPGRPGAPAPPGQAAGLPGALLLRATAGPVEGTEIAVAGVLDIGRSFAGPGALGGDERLSRRHARIARGPEGRFYIEDTGSTNGTRVNGRQVRSAQLLLDADEVRVGATTLTVSAPARETDEGGRPAPPGNTYMPQGAAGSRLATGRLVTGFVGAFGAAVAISVLAVLVGAPSEPMRCPRGRPCTPPPKSPALLAQTAFRSPVGWSAEYDPQTWTVSSSDPSHLSLTDGHDDALSITAMPASRFSPRAAIGNQARALAGRSVGLAIDSRPQDQVFALPAVGFHDGVGAVYAGTIDSPQGPGAPVVFEMVAARDATVTLLVTTATAAGRDQRANPGFANADAVLETIRFPSDTGA